MPRAPGAQQATPRGADSPPGACVLSAIDAGESTRDLRRFRLGETMNFYLGLARRFSTGSAIRTLLMEKNEEAADKWMSETFPRWIYLTRQVSGGELDMLRQELRCVNWR